MTKTIETVIKTKKSSTGKYQLVKVTDMLGQVFFTIDNVTCGLHETIKYLGPIDEEIALMKFTRIK